MHEWNRMWWKKLKKERPELFRERLVLEVGSYNINGSVREHFDNSCQYLGVDWREGEGVDIVCLAHKMDFQDSFDIIVSAQMLEHDPYWERSLDCMIDHLSSDGYLMLSWGPAHASVEHHLEAAPDGGYHALPAGRVWRHLSEHRFGLTVEIAAYEADFFYAGWRHSSPDLPPYPDGKLRDNYFVMLAAGPDAPWNPVRYYTQLLPADAWMPGDHRYLRATGSPL